MPPAVCLEGGGAAEACSTQWAGVWQQGRQVVLLQVHGHLLGAGEPLGAGRAGPRGRVLAHVCPALSGRGQLNGAHHARRCRCPDAMLVPQVPRQLALPKTLLQAHRTLVLCYGHVAMCRGKVVAQSAAGG